jgi:hypothetical protein
MQGVVEEKPTAAFVLSLLGGIFILIVGLILSAIGAALTVPFGGFGAVLGIFGVVCGILTIVGGVMMYSKPEQHMTWGVIVLIFSILSWFGAIGGFFIGFILALIGGILGMTFDPHPHQTQTYAQQPFRVCVRCGMQVSWNLNFCPNCGNDLRVQQMGKIDPPK